jgi:hypothetical protein
LLSRTCSHASPTGEGSASAGGRASGAVRIASAAIGNRRHFSAEPQAQAIVRLLHAGQAQAWPAGTERCNRSVQRSGFEQGLACR